MSAFLCRRCGSPLAADPLLCLAEVLGEPCRACSRTPACDPCLPALAGVTVPVVAGEDLERGQLVGVHDDGLAYRCRPRGGQGRSSASLRFDGRVLVAVAIAALALAAFVLLTGCGGEVAPAPLAPSPSAYELDRAEQTARRLVVEAGIREAADPVEAARLRSQAADLLEAIGRERARRAGGGR
jgi:hypothetical protein